MGVALGRGLAEEEEEEVVAAEEGGTREGDAVGI